MTEAVQFCKIDDEYDTVWSHLIVERFGKAVLYWRSTAFPAGAVTVPKLPGDIGTWSFGHKKSIPDGSTFGETAGIMRQFLLGDIDHDTYNQLLPN